MYKMDTEEAPSSGTKTSTLIATAKTFISVFASLDPSTISHIQSVNYTQEWAPSSAKPPPPLNSEQFASHLKMLGEILQSFPVRIKRIWPNPSLNQVTIWADSELMVHEHIKNSSDDLAEWSYRGEYIFVLTMDESGEKIDHVFEFVDSKGTDHLRGILNKARKRLADLGTSEDRDSQSSWLKA